MTSISLQNTINHIGLPLIVTSSKPNLCFLIDTGATHNVVFSYVYEELKDLFQQSSVSSTMMGIDGVPRVTQQVTCTIAFEDREATSTFSISEANYAVEQIQKEHGVQIHGILGIPFLTQNRWVLDFRNLTLQC